MFTGIIQGVGEIIQAVPGGGGKKITLSLPSGFPRISPGESVAVNGICLTVEACGDERALFSLSPQTLSCSHPSRWKEGVRANLEPALAIGERLGGHIVQGHVDGLGKVLRLVPEGSFTTLLLELPRPLAEMTVEKGSIAIDGVSLTIAQAKGTRIRIALVPVTLETTTLAHLKTGEKVHIETDILAKYVKKLLAHENV